MVYAVAKDRQKGKDDSSITPFVKGLDGTLITSPEGIKNRWKEYFETLLNEVNPFDGVLPLDPEILGDEDVVSEKK